MLGRLIRWRLGRVEQELGVSLAYLRHIQQVSTGAFLKFAKIMPLAEYRRTLPADAYYVARLVATRDEDCGTCVQIEINLAKKDGVSKDVIRAVVEKEPEALPHPLPDVYRFASAVVAADPAADELRPKMREAYGEKGLVELAFAMAACRVFPVTKRALGYAKSCAAVSWEV